MSLGVLSSQRVLVTGARGFIGKHLCKHLIAEGLIVYQLTRSSSSAALCNNHNDQQNLVVADIMDLTALTELITRLRIDIVYHLAACNTNTGSGEFANILFDINIRGTYTILEACRLAPQHISIIVSSSEEAEDCYCPPEEKRRAYHPYMVSKATTEMLAFAYHDTFGLAVQIARFSNIYGPGDLNWRRLIPSVFKANYTEQSLAMRTDGLLSRDFLYISDAVSALYLLARHRHNTSELKNPLFHFGTGIRTSVRDILSIIAKKHDVKVESFTLSSDSISERVGTSPTKHTKNQTIGWIAKTTLEIGLVHTSEWYKDYFNKSKGLSAKVGVTPDIGKA